MRNEKTQPEGFGSLLDMLALRVLETPHRTAFTFLDEEGRASEAVSFAQLEERARRIGARLKAAGYEGKTVVLMVPPGLSYIAALFGCMFAGCIAVPSYPPRARQLARFGAILADSGAAAALTTGAVLSVIQNRYQDLVSSLPIGWVDVDSDEAPLEPLASAPSSLGPDSIAFLQYTSGSTGSPKGVVLTHRNLLHNLRGITGAMGTSRQTVGAFWLPPYHDMGLIGAILQPLYCGGQAVLMAPAAFVQQPMRWLQAITRYRANTSGGPNFAYELCVEKIRDDQLAELDLSSWSMAFNGAEPVRAGTLRRFARRFERCGFRSDAFYACYGLAEATLFVSGGFWRPAPEEETGQPFAPVPCGKPLADQEVLIVDPRTRVACGPGEEGEIWVAGPSVASGYWGKGEETDATFRAFLSDSARGPFLRTGDLGRLIDGQICVTGRIKDLINLGGRKLYPQDIELSVQNSHAALRKGAVAAFSVTEGEREKLVVVQELAHHFSGDPGEVVAAIREALAAEHDVLSAAVVLVSIGAVSKTSSGKIQRSACKRDFLEGNLQVVLRSDSATEDALSKIWREVLRVEKVTAGDDFFTLGGQSVLATQVASRVRESLKVELPLRTLFEQPTLAGAAATIERLRAPALVPVLEPAPGGAERVPSFAQQRLWFLDQLEPGNPSYNIFAAVRLRGALDVGALAAALSEVVRRHEALRTSFESVDGRPALRLRPAEPLELARVDLRRALEEEREARAREEAAAEARRPFDLAHGPLVRARLLELGEAEHVLFLTMHHIASDGWSMGVLVRELAALYEAFRRDRPSPLAPLPIQYSDFAHWQRQWLQGEPLEEQLRYWSERLRGPLPVLDLPADRPRPAVRSGHGAHHRFALGAPLAASLGALSRERGATLFMTLLAAFKALLFRITGQEDVCVGTPIANRNRVEVEGLIGFFANTLVLRTDLSANPTFAELVGRVRETALGAYAHQDVPFERLVEELSPARDASRTPLFQVMFALQNAPMGELALSGLSLSQLPTESGAAKFDLTLEVTETAEGLACSLEYSRDLFEWSTAQRLAGHFARLLESAAADPNRRISDLSILSDAERETLLAAFNPAPGPGPDPRSVVELFELQVAKSPDAIAVSGGGGQVTYAELNARANGLARRLRELGVGAESRVGLCAERSPEMVAGILGILKAGGAYLPLDPSYPRERLAFMLDDARVSALVAQRHLASSLPSIAKAVLIDDESMGNGRDVENLPLAAGPGNLAYVIYTSGSTGRPKGAGACHGGLSNLLQWYIGELEPSPSDRILLATSLSFDLTQKNIFAALSTGARLHLAPEPFDAKELAACIARERITALNMTPSMFYAVADAARGEELSSLRCAVLGGEPLSAPALEERAALRGARLEILNGYGPTECTAVSAFHRLEPDLEAYRVRPIPIGRPIPRARLHVLDASLEPVPVGVAGELNIGGEGVGRGYLARPRLTAERFIPDPFSADPGRRLYRTGDRARYREDGNLEFLGRADHQVKVRGFRIELGEIEAALARHPVVREAVVVAREESGGDKRLVAYYTSADAVAASHLRDHLRESLPEYMVPSPFVRLEALPLTPNGKVNRQALPAPEGGPADLDQAFAAPRTPTEEVLAGIWAQVLRLEKVGVHDDFFELGGHSLLATQVASRVRAALGVELPVRSLFERPTLEGTAALVDQLRRSTSEPIEPAPRAGPLPLSFAQQRLWFLAQLEAESASYNVPAAVRLRGRLDAGAFSSALREIARRHEALRTTFPALDGVPTQVIAPSFELDLEELDLTSDAPEAREARVLEEAAREARRPFDLARGPLLRARLLALGEEEHVVLLTLHHIVSDGWSLGVLVRELAALYEAFASGRPSPLSPLPIQCADFAQWQRRWLEGERIEEPLAYWKQKLAGAPAALDLPTDRPRPAVQTFNGASHRFSLSKPLTSSLRRLGRESGATLFMVLLAGFKALLHRITGQTDLCVGSPVANRSRAEIEGLIGFFVNTLVLRSDLSADPSFRELLAQVRETALEAYAHQDLPFERLVEELAPARDLSRTPLFQVVFALQNARVDELKLAGLELSPIPLEAGTAKFDLTLEVSEGAEELACAFEFNTDLFDRSTVQRLADHFATILESAACDPDRRVGELAVLSARERESLLVAWNRTARDFPREKTVLDLFDEQVRKAPLAVAVADGDEELTYGELSSRADRLARRLRDLGAGPDEIVAVLCERSTAMVIAQLAALEAGAAYLPLDPSYPPERLRTVIEDSNARALLTQRRLLERLDLNAPISSALCLDDPWETLVPGALSSIRNLGGAHGHVAVAVADHAHVERPRPRQRDALADLHPGTNVSHLALAPETAPLSGPRPAPRDLAYVIYTSGSTGAPKGVAVEHRALMRLIAWHRAAYSPSGDTRSAQLAGPAFDAAAWELWPALASGARVEIVPEEVRLSPPRLLEWLAERRITIAFAPTALAEVLVQLPPPPELALRTLLTGGDKLHHGLSQRLPFSVVNHYGPTESAVVATCAPVPELPSPWAPPIGRPIDNTSVYVLDRNLEPVPVGVSGELFIGGEGLARSYWRRSRATAEHFLPDPFGAEPGGRLYRTGDLVRFRPDGDLEFLGRLDQQVKVRGFRVELGEIEAALAAHDAIREAVVVAQEGRGGEKQLVAYVVGSAAPPASELRAYLRRKLPEFMVPAAFVSLAAMPLTPNGKIDRDALPEPERRGSGTGPGPRTPTEQVLTALFEQLLGVEPIGVDDNFFELGGHSLLAAQAASRVRDTLRVEMPLRVLFEQPTIAGLAEYLEGARLGPSEAPIERAPRQAELPLSFAQQRLWFLDQLAPGNASYNIAAAVRLKGELHPRALERALNEVVSRHEALRTTFRNAEGHGVQIIEPALAIELVPVDLTAEPEGEREARAKGEAAREARLPFDLSRGPLVRAKLVALAEDDHLVLLTLHHIVSDGWSMGVLVRELAAIYEAFVQDKPSPLSPLPIQYADFAHWQRRQLEGERLAQLLSYWKERLAGAPGGLELPTDRPRPPVQTFRGAMHRFAIPSELAARLRRLCREEAVTPYMALLAVFSTLLHRCSGQVDLCVGTPVAHRNRAELEGLIGFFVNTVVVRIDLSANPTFSRLLERVREAALGAYSHQDLPFERLVDELAPARDLSRAPLFQVLFALQNAPMPELALPGLTLTPVRSDADTAKFDLTLEVAEGPDDLECSLEYNTDLFERPTAERLAAQFTKLLESAVADPSRRIDDLSLIGEDELRTLLVSWNASGQDFPRESTLVELFEEQAARAPDAVAVLFEEKHLTYGELNARANRLARRLRELGVGPEHAVGLCVERSLEMVVGVLGVVKAGGAYVPLDASYPQERLAFMLDDAEVEVLVGQAKLLAALPPGPRPRIALDEDERSLAALPSQDLPRLSRPDHLAYVIYTSGSTGRPKGTAVAQRSIVHLVKENTYTQLSRGPTILQAGPLSFDASTFEIWGSLLNGGRLAVLSPDTPTPEAIGRAVRRHGVETVFLTTALFHLIAKECPEQLAGVRHLMTGGEVISVRHMEAFRRALPSCRVSAVYGPTEATTFSSHYPVWRDETPFGSMPIGKPIAHAQLYCLDDGVSPVPVGAPGELFIGGAGVSRGYLRRPRLTAERFIPDPFGADVGARLYRTGDRVRWRSDGNLEFLARLDSQVKVRGFRVELEEVEAALAQHPALREVAVIAREDRPGERRLVAYYVGEESAAVGDLRAFLRRKLPEYMVPAAFVKLAAMPLTVNAKVDRKALPAPDGSRPSLEVAYVAPRSKPEEVLSTIWSELLGVERVGIHDNFFELGGDSILSIQVIARARRQGLAITPRQLFEHQTIAALAAVADSDAAALPEQGPVSGPIPLTPIQSWFFEQDLLAPHHFNQSLLLEVEPGFRAELLQPILARLVEHHDALRLRFHRNGTWQQTCAEREEHPLVELADLSALPENERPLAIEAKANELQAGLDLASGPLLRAAHFSFGAGAPSRLLIVAHHLAIDGVSWRILFEDLQSLYSCLERGAPPDLPPKTTSFKRWSERLGEHAGSQALLGELEHWKDLARGPFAGIPVDRPDGRNTFGTAQRCAVSLDADQTSALLQEVPAAYRVQVQDLLLAALALALSRWASGERLVIHVEGHGREDLFPEVDLSRTVGWFTALYPVALDLRHAREPDSALKWVKEALRRIPNHGLGYGVLRHRPQTPDVAAALRAIPRPALCFNYLGQLRSQKPFRFAPESAGRDHPPHAARPHLLDVTAAVKEGRLTAAWLYSAELHEPATIERVAASFLAELRRLIDHCLSTEASGPTPSDFPLARLDQATLDKLVAESGQ
jgi:amino acid adenylation domain-containing protein/non-ribosomal peptide synthase protein (TIGR01720 family)